MKKYSFTIEETANGWIGWNNNVPGVNCQEKNPKKLIKSLIQVTQIIKELEKQKKYPLQIERIAASNEHSVIFQGVYIGHINYWKSAKSSLEDEWHFYPAKNCPPEVNPGSKPSYDSLKSALIHELKIEE